MIRPLRRLHRWAITVLAVVVPVLFAVGLAARRPNPVSALPAALAPPSSELVGVRSLGDLWPGLAVDARIGFDPADPSRRLLVLIPAEPLQAPDPLVFWSAERTMASLPPSAVLLGGLAGAAPQTFQLPAAARPGPGFLILYSLAWGRVLAATALPLDLSAEGRGETAEAPGAGSASATTVQPPTAAR